MKDSIRIVPEKIYGNEYPSLTSRFAWVRTLAQAASAREDRVARAQVERIKNRDGN